MSVTSTIASLVLAAAATDSPTPTTLSSATATADTTSSTATCVSAVPDKYGYVPPGACDSYYNYYPQFTAAVATTVIFGLITAAHLGAAILYRRTYCWVVIMGATWETVAFVLLSLGAHDQRQLGYVIGHNLLFLLAPLWINAFVYMSFARAVYYFAPSDTLPFSRRIWIIPAISMSKYFVWFDILTFLVQASGGLMLTPDASPSTIKIGVDVYMAGLGFQEFFILVFMGLMISFHRECLAREKAGGFENDETGRPKSGWRGLLYGLYAALIFITLRICYRIAEYSRGIESTNPIPFHEFYSYVLDAFPMMVCLIILVITHPGRILRSVDGNFPRMKRREKKAAKKEAKLARKEGRAARVQTKGQSRDLSAERYQPYVELTEASSAERLNESDGRSHHNFEMAPLQQRYPSEQGRGNFTVGWAS